MYNAGQPIDSSSPLFPFRPPVTPSDQQGDNDIVVVDKAQLFLTAEDVRDTTLFGYTYDDLIVTRTRNQLFNRMNRLYGPEDLKYRWYMYANCSTDNPNVTVSWEISIDPTFMSTDPTKTSSSVDSLRSQSKNMSRRMLKGGDSNVGVADSADSPIIDVLSNETLEVSLGRTVLPHLMQYNMGMGSKSDEHPSHMTRGAATSDISSPAWVSATTSIDITHFLQAQGVRSLNPSPLDPDDLSLGPSSFPFQASQVGAKCQNYYSGTDLLPCQCQTKVSWVISEPGAFLDYMGPVPL